MSIHKKFLLIAAAAEKLRKDGYNQHHKYKFHSHGAVTAAVRDLLIEHGITTTITMRGGSCVVRLTDVEGEHVESEIDVPRPNDQPQSTGIIMSYAVKLVYQKTFLLEDETQDAETAKKVETAPSGEFDKLLQLLKDASSREELSKVASGLDQTKFSKDQWNKLSNQYKETLNAVANGNG